MPFRIRSNWRRIWAFLAFGFLLGRFGTLGCPYRRVPRARDGMWSSHLPYRCHSLGRRVMRSAMPPENASTTWNAEVPRLSSSPLEIAIFSKIIHVVTVFIRRVLAPLFALFQAETRLEEVFEVSGRLLLLREMSKVELVAS